MRQLHSGVARSTLLGILLMGTQIFGQQPQDKVAELRKHLGVGESIEIRPSLQPALPDTKPLRVALAFGLDIQVVQNFVKWVREDWNGKGDSKKYGTIELVDEIGRADVVLARYLQRGTDAGESASASAYGLGRVTTGRAQSLGLVPLQAFILKKTTFGFEVLGGYEATSTVEGSGGTGRSLWDEFKKLMKNRPRS